MNGTLRIARFSGIGLGLVLIVLTTLVILGGVVTDRTVTRATRSATLSAAWERAHYGVGEEESLERKYRLEPTPKTRARYDQAVAGVFVAMHDVTRLGTRSDAEIARQVLLTHEPYLAAIKRMFAAVDRGATPTVLRIDSTEVDPTFGKIQSLVGDASARQGATTAAALQDSTSLTRRFEWLGPTVLAFGLLLLALLWSVQRRTRRANEAAEHELAETRDRLRHAQRLESVGRLAGGIAHDFNNLLQIILGYSGILEPKLSEEPRKQLANITTAARRGSDLTRQLLAFGGRQLLKPEVWNVNAVVGDTEALVAGILPSEIDFRAVQGDNELNVNVDRGQLEQVLVNLILNARDAMPNGGTLTVFTEAFELEQALAVEDSVLAAGSYVRVGVRDTGCGMDAETKARAFEPFFTTKPRGEATGLGLATAFGIVHQSGGYMSLDSNVGLGTEIAVFLPRTTEPSARPTAVEHDEQRDAEIGCVLLVEDEPMVRSALASYLRGRGYSVLEAADGQEGLETFGEHRDRVSVVVTDIVMPRLDGWQLVDELRRAGESVPVVAMSGFTGEIERPADARLDLLHKPFPPAELVQAITRALLPRTTTEAA